MTDGTPSPEPLRGKPCSGYGCRSARHRRRPWPPTPPSDAIAAAGRSGRASTAPSPPDCCSPSAGSWRFCSGSRSPTSPRHRLHRPRDVRVAGPGPGAQAVGRHGVKRGWAIAIVFLTGSSSASAFCGWSCRPWSPRSVVHHRLPVDDRQLREDRLRTGGWRGSSAQASHTSSTRWRSSSPTRRTSRRSAAACSRSAPESPRRSRALLIIVVLTLYFVASLPGDQGVDDAVRAGPQPAEGARHDRPDHRLGRRVPHGHGHPGVLQLRRRDTPALGPAAALPAADGCAGLLDHDHPARSDPCCTGSSRP